MSAVVAAGATLTKQVPELTPDEFSKSPLISGELVQRIRVPKYSTGTEIVCQTNLNTFYLVRDDGDAILSELSSKLKKQGIKLSKSFNHFFLERYSQFGDICANAVVSAQGREKTTSLCTGEKPKDLIHIYNSKQIDRLISGAIPTGENIAVVCLDSARKVPGEYPLEISRVYAIGGSRKLSPEPVARPGTLPIEMQEQQLRILAEEQKRIIIIDDGTHTGGTLIEARKRLTRLGLNVIGAIVGTITGDSKDLERKGLKVVEELTNKDLQQKDQLPILAVTKYSFPKTDHKIHAEQFEVGDLAFFRGLTTGLADGPVYRSVVFHPFCDPKDTFNIPKNQSKQFSLEIWQEVIKLYQDLENQIKLEFPNFKFTLQHIDPFIAKFLNVALDLNREEQPLIKVFQTIYDDLRFEGHLSRNLAEMARRTEQILQLGFNPYKKTLYIQMDHTLKDFEQGELGDYFQAIAQVREQVERFKKAGYQVGIFTDFKPAEFTEVTKMLGMDAPIIGYGGRWITKSNGATLTLGIPQNLGAIDQDLRRLMAEKFPNFELELVTDDEDFRQGPLPPNTNTWLSTSFSIVDQVNSHRGSFGKDLNVSREQLGPKLYYKIPTPVWYSIRHSLLTTAAQYPLPVKFIEEVNPKHPFVIVEVKERELGFGSYRLSAYHLLGHTLGCEIVSFNAGSGGHGAIYSISKQHPMNIAKSPMSILSFHVPDNPDLKSHNKTVFMLAGLLANFSQSN